MAQPRQRRVSSLQWAILSLSALFASQCFVFGFQPLSKRGENSWPLTLRASEVAEVAEAVDTEVQPRDNWTVVVGEQTDVKKARRCPHGKATRPRHSWHWCLGPTGCFQGLSADAINSWQNGDRSRSNTGLLPPICAQGCKGQRQ